MFIKAVREEDSRVMIATRTCIQTTNVDGSTTFMTKVQGVLNKILPETTKADKHARESEPGSANSWIFAVSPGRIGFPGSYTRPCKPELSDFQQSLLANSARSFTV